MPGMIKCLDINVLKELNNLFLLDRPVTGSMSWKRRYFIMIWDPASLAGSHTELINHAFSDWLAQQKAFVVWGLHALFLLACSASRAGIFKGSWAENQFSYL